MNRKLKLMGVTTCGQLQEIPQSTLQKEFGPKTGLSLYRGCRGQDDRQIKTNQERKSVSAEVNYGIRFKSVRISNCFSDYCRVFSFWFLEDVGFEFFVYCGYILFFGFNVPLNKDEALSVSVDSIIQSQKLLIDLKFDCLTCIWILCAENGGR